MSESQDTARNWSFDHNLLESGGQELEVSFTPWNFQMEIGELNLDLIHLHF